MAIISILTDDHGRYHGTEVSPGIMECGWESKVFESPRKDLYVRVVDDFLSAITFLSKKNPFAIMFSSSVDEFVSNHRNKLTFFKFQYCSHEQHYRECEQVVIAPAEIKNQYDFCRYLADNEIYDVPEGYSTCWFISFSHYNGETVMHELKRRYPIVMGSNIVTVDEKRHGFLLHYLSVSELSGFLNNENNSRKITVIANNNDDNEEYSELLIKFQRNLIHPEYMETEFRYHIDEYMKNKIKKLEDQLLFSKQEMKFLENSGPKRNG